MNPFKNLFLCFFILIFCNVIVWAQCPQGHITLETQAQVDSFAVLYPDCTEIIGDLRIRRLDIMPTDISDLSPLSIMIV